MVVSRVARAVLGCALVGALAGYVVILDLGINAGRIHEGVSVAGIDVGGLTEAEASSVLSRRALELRHRPIFFVGDRVSFWVSANDVGWRPRVGDTVRLAMAVGRSGGPLRAASQRMKAWLSGVDLPFAGKPVPAKVARLVTAWEQSAALRGVTVDRGKLRYKIRRAVRRWPRGPFRVPVLQ